MLSLMTKTHEWIEFRIEGKIVAKISRHKDRVGKIIIEAPKNVIITRTKRVEGE